MPKFKPGDVVRFAPGAGHREWSFATGEIATVVVLGYASSNIKVRWRDHPTNKGCPNRPGYYWYDGDWPEDMWEPYAEGPHDQAISAYIRENLSAG